MKMNWKYVACGINGNTIPREAIPYKGELQDYNIIENSTGKSLIYHTKSNFLDEGFTLITDDPCNTWLKEEDIDSEWTKSIDDNLTWCIKQALKSTE
jgi:hypothetical protein